MLFRALSFALMIPLYNALQSEAAGKFHKNFPAASVITRMS